MPVSWTSLGLAGRPRGPRRPSTVEHLRVFTFAYGPDSALQVARPLTEVDQTLDRLRLLLLLIAAIGVAVAAVLGLLVSRAALAPVRRLRDTAERVTRTGDLSERIDASGRDELSSLAASFNSMLAALEDSTRAQRQLVADASHELRTPLTSLRTNIEVLASDRALTARRAGTAALGRRRAARRDDDPDLGADRARARRAADRRARGRSPRSRCIGGARARAQESPGHHVLVEPGRVRRQRRAVDDRACDQQPSRQRRQVEPVRW